MRTRIDKYEMAILENIERAHKKLETELWKDPLNFSSLIDCSNHLGTLIENLKDAPWLG